MKGQIGAALTALSEQLVWPVDSVEVDQAVVARLRDRSRGRSPARRRKSIYALVAVSIFSIVVFSVPPARQAVADLFGAAGIHITLGDPDFEQATGDLRLGREVTIGEAANAAGFAVVAPGGSNPGPPDGIFAGENGEVHMTWEGTLDLPGAGDTGIGLLFTQQVERSGEYQGVKVVSPESEVVAVSVEGVRGFWIAGGVHAHVLVDEAGVEREETRRLAANVLLWSRGGISYRLETTGDMASAIAFAESLRPAAD